MVRGVLRVIGDDNIRAFDLNEVRELVDHWGDRLAGEALRHLGLASRVGVAKFVHDVEAHDRGSSCQLVAAYFGQRPPAQKCVVGDTTGTAVGTDHQHRPNASRREPCRSAAAFGRLVIGVRVHKHHAPLFCTRLFWTRLAHLVTVARAKHPTDSGDRGRWLYPRHR